MPLEPVTFTHRGHTFRCWVDNTGVRVGIARPSSALWVIEVDGASYAPFDANPDDTPEDVMRRVREWFDAEHPR